jgi:serine/threonine-protein kinase PpkA
MATVYLAVQESLCRHVALKVMNQLLISDEDFRRRFLNEGRLIAKLSHPSIVTVYDIGVSESIHYLSMTYLPGGTLKEKIGAGLPLGYALYILRCVADALGYAHERGIVHRDIKPGNVLFSESGAPVLTDFGIAKTLGDQTKLTSAGMAVGSAGYMSPEQAVGREVDNRSDLYSLGILFWQMLTGSLPYSDRDPFVLALKHANDPVPRLPARLQRYQPVIDGLLAKSPEDRLGTADELVQAIERIPFEDMVLGAAGDADATVLVPWIAEQTPSRSKRLGREPQPTPPPQTRRLKLASALVMVLGVVGVGAYIGYGALFPSPPHSTPTTSAIPADAPTPSTPVPGVKGPPSQGSPSDTEYTESDGPRPLDGSSPKRTLVHNGSAQASGAGSLASVGKPEVRAGERVGPSSPAATRSEVISRTVSLGDDGQAPIERLLRRARAQWEAGRLIDPPGDNAFASYSAVLDLDPEHVQARERLVEIGRINAANRVFSSAESLLREGEIDAARRMIETGLKMNPRDERLLGLQRALDYGH